MACSRPPGPITRTFTPQGYRDGRARRTHGRDGGFMRARAPKLWSMAHATFSADDSVELAVIERSGFIESRHLGSAVVVAGDGSVVTELGDIRTPVYPHGPDQRIAGGCLEPPVRDQHGLDPQTFGRAKHEFLHVPRRCICINPDLQEVTLVG